MLNKAVLMGRLTRDPELRYTQGNVPVVTFSLAVDRGFPKNTTEERQTVDFINIVAWRNTAEFVTRWFRKGQLIAVTGRIQVRSWKDKDGNNRTTTEVVADECFFAESKASGGISPSEVASQPTSRPASFAERGRGTDSRNITVIDNPSEFSCENPPPFTQGRLLVEGVTEGGSDTLPQGEGFVGDDAHIVPTRETDEYASFDELAEQGELPF